jgi:hypothetical protein
MDLCDLDGDGDQDVVTSNMIGKSVTFLRNEADGTFVTVASYDVCRAVDDCINPFDIACCDLDGVNGPDVATANGIDDTMTVLFNDGNGNLSGLVDYPGVDGAYAVACCDIDQQSGADVITANLVSDNLAIFANDGAGNFGVPQVIAVGTFASDPSSVICTDVNGDSNLDLVTAYSDGLQINENECGLSLQACCLGDTCDDLTPGDCANTGGAAQGEGSTCAATNCDGCVFNEDCDDGNPCTDDICTNTHCTNTDNNAPCDDGDPCTDNDTCASGSCLGNPIPDCNSCAAPAVANVSSRYLQVVPGGSASQAIVVTTCSGPQYAGPWPGETGPAPIDLTLDGSIDGYAAMLVDDPAEALWLTPDEWGTTVWVTGIHIIPSGTFDVQADCGNPGNPDLTSPSTVGTWIFGDVDENGLANLADVLLAVQAFQNTFNEGNTRIRSDLAECRPDLVHNLADALIVVQAFQSTPFHAVCPESTCP